MPPARSPGSGTRTSVRISPGSSDVVNGPWKSSSIGIVRSPPGPRATTSARVASMTEPQSPCGSACASEPATVPRLRTIGSEITGAASPRAPYRPFSSSDRSAVLCRTRAPIRKPPSSVNPSSPSILLMSTSARGRAMRSFITGMRLMPPASTFPSSP